MRETLFAVAIAIVVSIVVFSFVQVLFVIPSEYTKEGCEALGRVWDEENIICAWTIGEDYFGYDLTLFWWNMRTATYGIIGFIVALIALAFVKAGAVRAGLVLGGLFALTISAISLIYQAMFAIILGLLTLILLAVIAYKGKKIYGIKDTLLAGEVLIMVGVVFALIIMYSLIASAIGGLIILAVLVYLYKHQKGRVIKKLGNKKKR